MTDFEKKVFDFSNKEKLFENCRGLILAVSGGPDSMALLRLFEKNRDIFSFPILCATVNHSIREESEEEVSFLENYCFRGNILFEKIKVDIPNICPKNVSVETFAREIRYKFFFELKEKYGFSHIATAHTSDDNAETVLMNIIRGCALSGICGIPPKREDGVVRPLLSCEKSELIGYCESENIKYFIDKTNNENIYRRNIIRNIIIPMLEKENPSVKKSINRLCRSARVDEDFILSETDKALKSVAIQEKSASIPISLFYSLSRAVFLRVIRKTFSKLSNKELSFDMTEDIFKLFSEKNTSDKVQVYDFYAVRTYNSVDFLSSFSENNKFLQIKAKINTEIPFFNGIVRIVKRAAPYKKNKNCISVKDFEDAFFRTRMAGDTFQNTKNGNKLIKKMFIDKKVSSSLRNKIPILEKNGKIIWAAFLGAAFSERADNCDEFYEVIFKLNEDLNN